MTEITEPILKMQNQEKKYTRLIPIKYHTWTCSEPKDQCENAEEVYQDIAGNRIAGVFREMYCNPSHCDHFFEQERVMILNHGNPLQEYVFPKLTLPFRSSMVRWWNLFYSGQYSMFDQDKVGYEQIRDVIAMRKPFGFAHFHESCDDDTFQEMQAQVIRCRLPSRIIVQPYGYKTLLVCQRGTLGELFNLNKWLISYKIASRATGLCLLPQRDQNELKALAYIPLEHWLYDLDILDRNYDVVTDKKTLALRDLILGYPLESTIALILSKFF